MERHRNILGVCLLPLLIGQVIITVSSKRETGIYFDNEYNQTKIERWLSMEEKTDLEYKILRLLGLPEKPQHLEKRKIMKRSGPKFLLDVYKNEVDYNSWNNNGDFKLNEKNSLTINQSDVIISFMAQQSRYGDGGKPNKVKRMWFNVSGLPVDDDSMMSAELRLYRGSQINRIKDRGAFNVTVYRVSYDADGNKDRHFVDSLNISAGYIGWITLNVSESLRFWTKKAGDNCGLSIIAHLADETDSRKVQPENIGIIGFDGDAEKQPFMIGFYKNSGEQKILRIIKDSVTRYPRKAPARFPDFMHFMEHNDIDETILREACGLRKLHVVFKDIQWHESILAPDGFDASFCSGECDFPLHTRMNTTNHAIVQSLMHLHHPEIPKPCCTPRKYSDLQVIYYGDMHTAFLKRIQDIIVNECGCS